MSMNPLCSIMCVTYNHRPYITQALDSFVSQRTNFPFEIVIGDDGSDDGTTEICAEYAAKYPRLIRHYVWDRRISVTYKNPGVYNSIRVFHECRGKYISLCEGDDFYPTPETIQLQVDFLEQHPDHGMVHGMAYILDGDNCKLDISYEAAYICGDVFNELVSYNFIRNCTTCCRTEFRLEHVNMLERNPDFVFDDRLTWMLVASQSKIGYIRKPLATYRINPTSLSRNPAYVDWNLHFSRTKYRTLKHVESFATLPFSSEELMLFYLRRASTMHGKYHRKERSKLYDRHYREKLAAWMAEHSCFVQDFDPVEIPE